MEWRGMSSEESSFVSVFKPLMNTVSLPLVGWVIDRFSLCPVLITSLLTICNGLVFLAWPSILGKKIEVEQVSCFNHFLFQ